MVGNLFAALEFHFKKSETKFSNQQMMELIGLILQKSADFTEKTKIHRAHLNTSWERQA